MDIKTRAIVLRRTNYGEADRILNILTPEGKKSVIAKGVRREKSKLAGGIELFSVSNITVHAGKGDLGILTSSRLQDFYSHILEDYATLQFAYEVLKSVNKKAENLESPEFFNITEQALAGLNSAGFSSLIAAWWWLNLARAAGEPINFHTDTDGHKLKPDQTYLWDPTDLALRPTEPFPHPPRHCEERRDEAISPSISPPPSFHAPEAVSSDHIKLLRLLISSPLSTALKVSSPDPLLPEITTITKCFTP